MEDNRALGTSIALGLCFGVAFGAALDNVALGVAFGPLLGILYHLAVSRSREAAERADEAASGDQPGT